MTNLITVQTPSFVIEHDPTAHKYAIDGQPVPSVTQVLGIVDKSGPLMWWAQSKGIEGLLELIKRRVIPAGALNVMISSDVVKMLTENRLTVNHQRDAAGTRGTSVHSAAESFAKSGTVPDVRKFPEHDQGYVEGLAKFFVEKQPEFKATEVIVGSKEHGYAGKLDAYCIVDGLRWLYDWKTSSNVYPTQHFPQLEAYAHAGFECGHPYPERKAVVLLTKDGDYEIHESIATFLEFTAILDCYRAVEEIKAKVKAKKKVAA